MPATLAFLSVGYMYLYSLRTHVAYLYVMHCYCKAVSRKSQCIHFLCKEECLDVAYCLLIQRFSHHTIPFQLSVLMDPMASVINKFSKYKSYPTECTI